MMKLFFFVPEKRLDDKCHYDQQCQSKDRNSYCVLYDNLNKGGGGYSTSASASTASNVDDVELNVCKCLAGFAAVLKNSSDPKSLFCSEGKNVMRHIPFFLRVEKL